MGILEEISSQKTWEEFLAHRLQKGRFNWREFDEADIFVGEEQYLPVVRRILSGEGPGVPQKKLVNKMGSDKKRVVYSFGPEEMAVLKLISFLLYKYDSSFASNCYAFRRGLRATDAVLRVHKQVRDKRLWAYKTDIHDYFNSIPVSKLLPKLKALLDDDPGLYGFFERMLSDDRAVSDGVIIHEKHGVMAGIPTAPFFADVYLSNLDHYFEDQGVIYARYSDDIIVFAEERSTLEACKEKLLEFISDAGLEVNPSKERIFSPDEPYEFLGFSCKGDVIDISSASIEKMKGKIRRKMRAVQRWKKRRDVAPERAMERIIAFFNRKFFDTDPDEDGRPLTWARWYFPVITTDEGLRKIDHYLQQCIRVVCTGRYNSSNFKVSYDTLKNLGYRSLVHEYYESRNGKQ